MKNSLLLFMMLIWFAQLMAQNEIPRLKSEYDSLRKTTLYGKNPKAGRYWQIRGFKMYCETYGTGEPLLFIHGNGASIQDFVKQIPYFSKKYQVIVADSRAHGKSVDKKDSLTYEMMADDYAALLSAMKIDSANVIGWSDGGINGLLLAIRHPEKVKKLVITGANLRPDSSAVEQDVINLVNKTWNFFVDKFKDPQQPKTPLDSMVIKYIRLLTQQPHIPLTDLQKIKIPTFVIGGDFDVIKPAHALQIFQNIPKANLWILPNSGHSTLIVYTDEFNQKVEAFLKTPYRKITGHDRFF